MLLSGLLENQQNVQVTTLSQEQIEDLTYNGKSKLPDFHLRGMGELYFPVVMIDGIVVAIAKVWKSTMDRYPFHSISMFEVAPEYRGAGYATMLADEMFRLAKEKGLTLGVHDYTKDGWTKLKPLFIEKAKQYGVKLVDTESKLYTDRGEDWGEPVRKSRFK